MLDFITGEGSTKNCIQQFEDRLMRLWFMKRWEKSLISTMRTEYNRFSC